MEASHQTNNFKKESKNKTYQSGEFIPTQKTLDGYIKLSTPAYSWFI